MDNNKDFEQYKYPEIVTDKDRNSALQGAKILTIEEYEDIMHHTHDLSTLISGDGGSSEDIGEDAKADIVKLYAKLSDLIERVEKLEQYTREDIKFKED